MSNIGDERRIKNVLVIGANGTVGNGVARAFVRAGYVVYGLIRNPKLVSAIAAQEMIPCVGGPDNLDTRELRRLNGQGRFDVIVSATEDLKDYITHYNNIIFLIGRLAIRYAPHRPLVLFTSGCKDYGTTPYHLSPDLKPHTEQSPLCPPIWARDRATHSVLLLEDPVDQMHFDAIVLRPTTIYGYSASFYGPYFELAKQAKEKGVLELPAERKNVVLHGTHVDDCGEAYVALAETYLSSTAGADRVKNRCYNISSHRYETLAEIAEALVREYGISGGIKWVEAETGDEALKKGEKFDVLDILTGYSQ